jgi:peptidylprolyl isomerase
VLAQSRRRPGCQAAVAVACALALAACAGDDGDGASSSAAVDDLELVPGASTTTTTTTTTATTTAPAGVPVVSLPAGIPTELVVTDLVAGTGPAAAAGDTVVVDYVGVRSEDGEVFDSSYGEEPYDVALGSGGVIAGWDQGLVGVRAGGRRQLDIPNDLAYGDVARGDVIRAGDALSFVIDVRAVIPAADPAAAPTDIAIEPSTGAAATATIDAVVGDGATVSSGDTGIVRLLIYRGDDAALLYNSWDGGEPLRVELVDGSTLPGLITGLVGMQVGGRRVITMPPSDAFGEAGDPQLGLPAGADLIVVAELVGIL